MSNWQDPNSARQVVEDVIKNMPFLSVGEQVEVLDFNLKDNYASFLLDIKFDFAEKGYEEVHKNYSIQIDYDDEDYYLITGEDAQNCISPSLIFAYIFYAEVMPEDYCA